MSINSAIEHTCALLLVGGMGTRLRSVVPSVPKPLASVGGHPFLELLVRQLHHQGIRRLVMCTGYLGDQIEGEFGDGLAWDVEICYSREPHQLGTAGAVKNAEAYLRGATDFLVLNGDSFLEIDFGQLVEFHHAHGGVISMAVRHVNDASRYGTVQVGEDHRVVKFEEKSGQHGAGLINAGVYVLNRVVLDHIPAGQVSLEKHFFPNLLHLGVYALETCGAFIDIGTPEDYAVAQNTVAHLYGAAYRRSATGAPLAPAPTPGNITEPS